ncbi:anthranilate synthase component II [Roseivirga pacifica]|uniref:anthranilate synthase component II n=1 Tax=Roseivirga pacifica TaxID=1267423 RepID=UPI0020952488|nr:aminodeoxychorismate/anthranilate synthase component II [Roseivirga pacifica]MCO6359435.1 aminodeoxychorismate/anthranilate synthase component II [Roseivirga pacifica]MCO6366805.1 aminodeoxychorismate/anthranilate synthase component II [Roseivirga pacifica]MCO6370663.1 aminodeoxychorismate/anthranilate synthase component II [Roseivirga pacifica]MCO6374461.1 aminodeoxychorismate/anthranilate synthase component II [Roseivirga pacifica]MCO6379720.1 aminodeoxychorismate/anthranilate synthase co
MILLIDNYDSFTYNLVDYFEQAGAQVEVLRNDIDPAQIDLAKYKGLVLSPGPEEPRKAGNLMPIIEAFVGKIPMLGVCLGHQAIAIHFGGTLVKAIKPMHGKISKIDNLDAVLFQNIPRSIDIVRYHSLVIKDLPKTLKKTAFTQAGELMAFESLDYQVHGLQFHPEAVLTEYGLEMLRNWVTFYNIA